jgi:hypothetical protein
MLPDLTQSGYVETGTFNVAWSVGVAAGTNPGG